MDGDSRMKFLDKLVLVSNYLLLASIIAIVILGFFDDEILKENADHQMQEQVEE